MIDTIILQIPLIKSAIINPDQFKPSARILESVQGFFKCVNNPSAIDKKQKIYKPKLTIIKRGSKIYLKIEFSAPKLLFGNNLNEVEEQDFDEVISRLRKIVEKMGVRLWSFEIENAEVLGFHPAKNILLRNGYTSSFVIRELAKINLNQKLDLEKVSFRNNGEVLQFYSNRHSFVLYDKINDLKKPPKRAIDKEETRQQIDLFTHIKQRKERLEVLRIEVRLSHKTKMIEVLKKIGFTDTPLFKNIFKKEVCQKIFKLYWEQFFGKNRWLISLNNSPQKILQLILIRYPKTKIKTAIFLVGLYLLCKDKEGIRGFKEIAKNYKPKTNWIMLNNYLKKFEDEIFFKSMYEFTKDIEKEINEFKPLNLHCKEL